MLSDWDYSDPTTGLFSHERFWLEKVSWAEAGNRTPEGQHCIRIDGIHYVAKPGIIKPKGFMGFGGRVMRWLTNSGAVFESNNVWDQGKIPAAFRDRLPDNAQWLPVEPVESVAAALERLGRS